ncbi:hypothetical protein Slala03_79010 [Streptomyces lavendulae subsp. lavendulae]|uniref:tryptophan halogenase family protein n=1 Tax=Streptomyces lavendulae TaxID=1914 RepID=UPI0024A4455A|nr:tryptophan halogenase family protein [Streptomyces lavendulae]GLV88212.1 hypothetical protein Slala03_79010 [Streptomyces lavendulae subsp. lavendulae]
MASDSPTRNVPADLAALIDGLPAHDATVVRDWLAGDPNGPDTGRPVGTRALFSSTERAVEEFRPASDDEGAIRSVGVIGGGTAGYLTALALRAKRPWLDVTLVESAAIPIIGVGEATTPAMVTFLHHYLDIDPERLYREVDPTWKLGIKFDWGPDPDGFMAPFDWDSNAIGMLGALAETGGIDGFSLQSLLMRADRTPVFRVGDRHVSLMKHLPFAYHLDNGRFVAFLTRLARERGVRHVDARLRDAVLDSSGNVAALRADDGSELSFDFYVDCTGFRSMLLGTTMGTPFRSYADSLFTDSAVTVNTDHGGHLKPYTTATTMDAGWCWTIPTPQNDHHGYVYSSAALSEEEAVRELARRFPESTEPRHVKFRVGRREEAWRGNVMAVGNSYAFVEPLESSGLLMITMGIQALVSSLPASLSDPSPRELVNRALADRWDAIRWFLSIHYRFNTRKDTPFWRDARTRTDISGLQPLVDAYAGGAPLRYRNPFVRALLQTTAPTFYGLAGVDTILLGQRVPARILRSDEPPAEWHRRHRAAKALVAHALPQDQALAAYATDPRLLKELLEAPDSWASRATAVRNGMG